MPELRWILIACGALLLVAIYLWGRRTARQSAASEDASLRMHPESQVSPPAAAMERFARVDDDADEASAPVEIASSFTRPSDFSITAIRTTSRTEEPEEESSRSAAEPAYRPISRDARRARIEPTFDDTPTDEVHATTVELPVNEPPEVQSAPPVPTLSMSSTPAPKRIERRKIVALRLAAGTQRFAGAQLRQTLEEEGLEYGKYDVFHRLHTDGAPVFSVASMVEPGSFDLEQMSTLPYPGVTLFAQLPGPVAGIEAMNQLVACGKRLQENLGGTLQDERGVPLTVHRMERMRQEIREFENAQGRESHDAGRH